ncbi:hypothetical protein QQ045_027749 [Rhodiola kirilowii]
MSPFLFIFAAFLTVTSVSATTNHIIQPSTFDLAARLEESGGITECWNALLQLRSCSNELIAFFLNGHADISSDCCNAITTITHRCWPAMLSSLGFTAEEGHVLSGYCDGSISDHGPTPAASP